MTDQDTAARSDRVLGRAWLAAFAVSASVLADVALDPVHTHVPLCPFKAVTGQQCPFCGCLRSAYYLVHGDLTEALRCNSMFVVSLPLVLAYWIDWVRHGRARVLPRPVIIGAVALAVVFTVLRNLPWFAYLRP